MNNAALELHTLKLSSEDARVPRVRTMCLPDGVSLSLDVNFGDRLGSRQSGRRAGDTLYEVSGCGPHSPSSEQHR